jgi:transposase InsO family protein
VGWLAAIAEVSRSGYYKWQTTQEKRKIASQKNQLLKEKIMEIHQLRPFFGYPRMLASLRKAGFLVNHKRVYRLMKELQIQSVIRKKRRYFGRVASVVHPNRLNRQFLSGQPNRSYATDITYLPMNGRFYYLSAVQDLFNNEIVAWIFSPRNDLKLVMDTVKELQTKRDLQGALLHSDQGFQYTSRQYNKQLEKLGVTGSHSRKGNCLDNACIESFFSHLKTESLYFSQCKTEQELIQAVQDYIGFYNHERFQKRLNQCSPIEYRRTLVA